jgi:hypothetical protein
VVAALCGGWTAVAQTNLPAPTGDGRIRLMLIPDGFRNGDGGDQKVTIRFINDGDNTVSLPPPTMFCDDSRDGFVVVYSQVLNPKDDSKGGTGCMVDKVARGNILEEASRWITIPPRSSFDIVEPLSQAVDTSQGTRFEMVASYYPAHVNSEEFLRLKENGIYLVQAILASVPLVIDVGHPK